jgi:predicted lactoylglutathione lyase
MTKDFWLNLPVKDVSKSKEFFTQLGFTIHNDSPGNSPTSCPVSIGSKNVVVMLFETSVYKQIAGIAPADTATSSEVMLSFDAETREEVDELARKAQAAGGIVFGKPTEIQSWMYGCGFADLDGHRWNVLHMDMSKMQG